MAEHTNHCGGKLQKTSTAKSDTRSRVKLLRSANLLMKMSEIGRQIGISRQRVYRILRDEGLPTKHLIIKRQTKCYACRYVGLSVKVNFAAMNAKIDGHQSQ